MDNVAEGERFALAAKQTTTAAKTNSNVGTRMVVDGKSGMVIRKAFLSHDSR